MRSSEIDMSRYINSESKNFIHPKDIEFILRCTEEERPKLEDFENNEDGYTSDVLKRDKQYLSKLKEKISQHSDHLPPDALKQARENKQRSDALEAAMVNLGELSNWFGENSAVFRTTEYDDVVNGVDAVVEINPTDKDEISEDEVQRVALAIDASTSIEREVLEKKINRNIKKIMGETEHDFEVKYFKSELTDYTGPLQDIIPVVIGIESKNANELLSIYARILELKKKGAKKDEEEKTELKSLLKKTAEHPAQVLFFEEIKDQLDAYKNLLNSKRGIKFERKLKIYDKINELLATIAEIEKDKRKKNITTRQLPNDRVYTEIANICGRFDPNRYD